LSITNEVNDFRVNACVFSRLNREDTVSETSILQTSLTNMNGYVNINKNDVYNGCVNNNKNDVNNDYLNIKNDVNNGYVNNDEKMNQLLQSYFF
jgi:hypothetical protein